MPIALALAPSISLSRSLASDKFHETIRAWLWIYMNMYGTRLPSLKRWQPILCQSDIYTCECQCTLKRWSSTIPRMRDDYHFEIANQSKHFPWYNKLCLCVHAVLCNIVITIDVCTRYTASNRLYCDAFVSLLLVFHLCRSSHFVSPLHSLRVLNFWRMLSVFWNR